jgi:Bacterial transcriptional activator domain
LTRSFGNDALLVSADPFFGTRRALSRLIERSPMSCQAVSRLIQIEAACGHVPEALLHYERYNRRLTLEFNEEPRPELHRSVV